MQYIYRLPLIKKILLCVLVAAAVSPAVGQSVQLPYSYQLDQKFNSSIYSINSSFHTSLKPFLIDSTIAPRYNQLMNRGVDSSRKTWLSRKIFNEHLFDVKGNGFTFYGDYLTDLQAGRDFNDNITTQLNTRGFQFGGTVGDKFFFYTSGFENSGKFPTYYADIINGPGVIPGQSYDRSFGQASKDWSYVTAVISYTPIKQLNITMGQDKTFIGDGYRSLLLSDFSANAPLLRVTANLGKVQYMMMWSYMEDRKAVKFDSFGSNRRKWGGFHYLDWNVTNRLSIGYFNAFISEEADDLGHFHGFDANFFDPVYFANAFNSSSSAQPDKILTGFTAKYKLFDKNAVYGQVLLDRGNPFSGGSNANTGGFQLGIRGGDLAGVKDLNYLVEFNSIKPFTYATSTPITSYSNFDEPLADPFGANTQEFIGILNYSIGRFDLMGELMYAKYGSDPLGSESGMNVLDPYEPVATPAYIGQGIMHKEYYGEGTLSFLINPKTNLRFEAGALLRVDKVSGGDNKTFWITFGLRSSFRQIYHDL